MFNLVELCADEDEQSPAPCRWGNIVAGHACYCHKDDWEEGPRKCPIWREFGTNDLSKWHKREWEFVELPMYRPELPEGMRMEKRPCMQDDDLGGCPMFEPREADSADER